MPHIVVSLRCGSQKKNRGAILDTRGAFLLRPEPLEARIAPAFVHPFPLASLDGGNGFTINGVAANDFVGNIAEAGDVNGDGFGDVIVAASGVSGGTNNAGEAYVIFGKATGFDPVIELSALDGNNGFKLTAVAPAKDHFFAVSGAGDVNGDGFADVVIGSQTADGSEAVSGAAWVVFGHAAPFSASFSLAAVNGTNGFKINGVKTQDQFGGSVAAAGDVNGDGFGDVIIGAQLADRGAVLNVGAAYVILGRSLAFPSVLSAVQSFGTFGIFGAAKDDRFGISVSGAGDVNGDGFDDVIAGALQADPPGATKGGASYVVFGRQFPGFSVLVKDLDGGNGFRIRGVAKEYSGTYVSEGGDINGDGFADLLVGSLGSPGVPTRTSVVFGHAAPFTADFALSTLNGSNGFRIFAEGPTDGAREIHSAGDVNGDGFDDFIVGAQLADTVATDTGAAYLIFGGGAFGASFSLGSVDGTNGFKLTGSAESDFAGATPRSAGDVNGDGFDDLVLGARGADPGGRAQAGQAYVIFGSDTGAVTHPGDGNANTLNGDGNANVIGGGRANDALIGGGGADILRGGQGDDVLAVSDLAFRRAEGGLGTDTLRLDGAGLGMNLATLSPFQLRSIETIDLTGSGDNALTLRPLDLLGLSGESNTLTIFGNAGDAVNFGAGWLRGDAELVGGVPFAVFFSGEAKLRVAPAVTTSATNGFSLGQSGDFKLRGASAQDRAGGSIASAGDVNGDGFDDVIIGAQSADGAFGYSGAAYVVFGKPGGFAGGFDLAALDGMNGFRITGGAQGFGVGRSVGAAGDFNGDGFADIIVGAPSSSAGGTYSGAACIIFGKASPFSATIDAATLDGTNGFRFTGEAANQFVGEQVGFAGDLNGDGFDDVFVGSSGADLSATVTDSGAVHVIFGTRDKVDNFGPSSLFFRGFTVNGAVKGDRLSAGGAAGDINGDGFDDLIIGGKYADANGFDSGAAYVIYGKADRTFPFKVADLDGKNGFRMRGEKSSDRLGGSVSGAGDVNGDGFDDLLIGTETFNNFYGASYVVFGKSASFGATFDLSKLNGVNGFEVNGGSLQFGAGRHLAAAGDVNGDGFDDMVFGGESATLRGSYSGGAFVVYGKAGGFTSTFSLGSLDAQSGFILSGEAAFNSAGFAVGGGGDVNGDGFDDVLVGAPFNSANGSYSGAGYVFFGFDSGAVTHPGDANANALTGNANANVLIGGRASDTLLPGGGADVARGAQGDDIFGLGSLDFFRIRGGLGTDTLRFDGAGLALDLTTIANTALTGIERIDLAGTGANSLTLTQLEVLNLSPTSNTLTVIGDAGDTVNFGPGWIREPDTAIGVDPFRVFTNADGAAKLFISAAVSHPLPSGYTPPFFGGTPGVTINGVGSNNAVSAAGDVNGDGFDDFLFGALHAAPNGAGSGAAYVVFGSATGLVSPIGLSSLNGTNGFAIFGEAAGDFLGFFALDSAGDFNGDGFGDIILGSHNTSGANQSGSAYIVFGKGTAFDPTLQLSALDGVNGFKLRATASATDRGVRVGSAGDVNGDGFSDVVIGAPGVSPAAAGNGAAYVVFGRATSTGAVFDLAGINGVNGFAISGAKGDRLGGAVSGADVNGDGFSDVIVGATRATAGGKTLAGKTYVVFGKAAGFASKVSAATLKAADGFTLNGATQEAFTGTSVSGAGDVNGDGVADLIVSASRGAADPRTPGEAFVIFGKNGGSFGAEVNLAALTGANGFRINGLVPGGQAGVPVSAAGDVNGDGFDDLLVGSPYGSRRDQFNGEAYVIYGKGSPFSATLDARTLDGANGFSVIGSQFRVQAGQHVSHVGDVNGDGFDDLLVGTYGGAAGLGLTGKSYLVFGFDHGAVTQRGDASPNTLNGTGSGDILVAGQDDDALLALNTGDSARGGEGDDLFAIALQTFRRIAGGTGVDTLRFDGVGLGLNLPALPDAKLTGIEQIDLRGNGANTLTLNLREVANLSPSSNTLVVARDADDPVLIGPGWINQGNEIIGADSFVVFKQGAATLKVQEGSFAITLVNATTATFTDVDGDLATIKVSKGLLSVADFNLAPAGSVGGFQLQSVNFADDGAEFQDSDLSITAVPQAIGGDGRVNVGYIFSNAVDLSKVTVEGDLGGIMAGDATVITPGVDVLTVHSMGRFGISTQGPGGTGFSVVTGKLGALNIATDFITSLTVNAGINDAIGTAKIGGSILPLAGFNGLIAFGNIGSIAIGQDIRGGAGAQTGIVSATGNIGSIAIGGSLVGGAGFGSGAVTVNGTLGATTIGGDIDGGRVWAFGGIKSLAVTGSALNAEVLSGYGTNRVAGNADATIGAVTVGGDWVATNLVAGAQTIDPFFGNGADQLIGTGGDLAKIAKITSIAIKGQAIGTPGGTDHFGFVAEEIGSFTVGGTKFPLAKNASNDLAGFDVGATIDVKVREVNATASPVEPPFTGSGGSGSAVPLATLDGSNGFRVNGAATGDSLGRSVASAGDVNDDGFDDIIVGARGAGAGDSGEAYVVFGSAAGFPASFDSATLNGSNGFRLTSSVPSTSGGAQFGIAVGGAGDVNGDGIDDMIVGSIVNLGLGGTREDVFVVFGRNSGFTASIDVAALNGTGGFELTRPLNTTDTGLFYRMSASGAGDVNGDGFDDVVIGAVNADFGAQNTGSAFVYFGNSTPPASVNLDALNGTNGFRLDGATGFANLGYSTSGAGDLNGDGLDDLIVGAQNAFVSGAASGSGYVVFGKTGAFPASLTTAALDGTNGFRIPAVDNRSATGSTVSGGADVNGDGFDDIVIGAPYAYAGTVAYPGASYVIFGKKTSVVGNFPADFALGSLNGTNGFKISGESEYDYAGRAVIAGDVNGDGLADILVGAIGIEAKHEFKGGGYLVFGTATSPANVALAGLTGTDGFKILGVAANDQVGIGVAGAGDVNGDGRADLLLGAEVAQPNGSFSGSAFVVFGATGGGSGGPVPLQVDLSVDRMTATFTDADGDLVTVKTSAGLFEQTDFTLISAGRIGGAQLQKIDLSGATHGAFMGANITITAARGPLGGDGFVNVGALFATDNDLGKVTIDGDLGQLDAGNGDPLKPAVAALTVQSLGRLGLSTQTATGASLESNIKGKLGAFTVKSDLVGAFVNIDGSAIDGDDDSGAITIGGALRGGALAGSGSIFAAGDLGAVKIGGSILGGAGAHSGSVEAGGKIASISLGGALRGGAGSVSGSLIAGSTLGGVKIDGDTSASRILARGNTLPASNAAALALKSITIGGSVLNTKILAGFDREAQPANSDAQIGDVTVNSDWVASDLVAGVQTGADGYFGNGDQLIAGGGPIVARIADILIKGQALGTTTAGDHFGFVAEQIASLRTGKTSFPLKGGAANDLSGVPVGATADLRVSEG